MCLLIFWLILKSDDLVFHSWLMNLCQQLFWDREVLNKFMSQMFCLLGLLYSRQSNNIIIFLTDFLCLVQSCSTADWDCSSIFFESFSKKELAFFFFMLLIPVQCLDKTFYLFIYLLRSCMSSTGAKTIGHKSPTRFKHQPNPLLKF